MAVTYRYDRMNRLVCEDRGGEGERYVYDPAGNLLLEEEGGKKKEYGYDALNRLARVRTADGRVWENLYDGEGLRAGTRGDGACTTFLYRNGEILAECGEDGNR